MTHPPHLLKSIGIGATGQYLLGIESIPIYAVSHTTTILPCSRLVTCPECTLPITQSELWSVLTTESSLNVKTKSKSKFIKCWSKWSSNDGEYCQQNTGQWFKLLFTHSPVLAMWEEPTHGLCRLHRKHKAKALSLCAVGYFTVKHSRDIARRQTGANTHTRHPWNILWLSAKIHIET